VVKRELIVETGSGRARAALLVPEPNERKRGSRGQPGAILYMDAFGLRPSLEAMGERLARQGYVVLVPDLFYRFGAYGPYDTRKAFDDEKTRAEIMRMLTGTSQAMTESDGQAFLQALEANGSDGPIGTVGYCMGGGRAIIAAAAYPDRIVAAASFHGGNLASDADDSPHRRVASIKGRVYVGCAGVDNSFPPEQSARLAEALRRAEVDHAIENYVGMAHGWAVPDHRVFNAAGAERHWRRLSALFEETLQ